ncbi:MAG: hypothetical protein AB1Z98_39240 [Nannocystaceae bacterium]
MFEGCSLRDIAKAKQVSPPRGRPDRTIPASVHRVLRRAVEPAPEDRWPSIDAMLAALHRAARPRRGAWALGVAAVGGLGLAWASAGPIGPDPVPMIVRERFLGAGEDRVGGLPRRLAGDVQAWPAYALDASVLVDGQHPSVQRRIARRLSR